MEFGGDALLERSCARTFNIGCNGMQLNRGAGAAAFLYLSSEKSVTTKILNTKGSGVVETAFRDRIVGDSLLSPMHSFRPHLPMPDPDCLMKQ